jgi:hypothetical protein
MARAPLPEPSSGFRPGDLMRLLLAISFLFLLVLAIVRFRNPATWQWVRNITPKDTSSQLEAPNESKQPPVEPLIPSEAKDDELDPDTVYKLGQLGLLLAGSAVPPTDSGAIQPAIVSLIALVTEAFHYAQPVPRPVPTPTRPARVRHALAPDMSILRGARDREPFLIEHPADPNNLFLLSARQDADARYHLIELVLEQARGGGEAFLQQLHLDARWGVPYELLRDKPRQFRGEVIGVRGTLVWIKRFALERGGRGMLPEHIYHGILEQDGLRDRPVWILFTDLPPGFPPEKDWSRLFLSNTTFVGYYLKVVEIDAPPDPRPRAQTKPRPTKLYFPVLVGYRVELSSPPPQENWLALLGTVAAIVAGIVLIAAIALYFYYRSERPYLEKMAQVRQRVAEREQVSVNDAQAPLQDFRLEDAGPVTDDGTAPHTHHRLPPPTDTGPTPPTNSSA